MWDFDISVLADSGDPVDLIRWLDDPRIEGATTNPSLLRKSGSGNEDFLAKVAPHLTGRPISVYPVELSHNAFLRAADNLRSIYPNVFIKIPVLDRDGVPNNTLLEKVAANGHNINVTAVHDAEQAVLAEEATRPASQRVVSVFAGRLADSGRDPMREVAGVCQALAGHPDVGVVWASSRQAFDVQLASQAGCGLITIPTSILARPVIWGYDITALTVLAVRQFEEGPDNAAGESHRAPRSFDAPEVADVPS